MFGDLIHKLGISAKEVHETIWWLRIVDRKRLASSESIPRWIDEARQLLAILISIARTARTNSQHKR